MKKVKFAVLAIACYVGSSQLIGCGLDLSTLQGSAVSKGQQNTSSFSQSALSPSPGTKPTAPPPPGGKPPCPQGPPPPFGVKHLAPPPASAKPSPPPPCLPQPTGSGAPAPKPSVTPKPSGSPTPAPSSSPGSAAVPAIFSKMYGAQSVYMEGNYVVITSNGRPEHKSPYYKNTAWEGTLYEAYTGDPKNFKANPNQIAEYALGVKIPVNPTVASTHTKTQGGPIGIAVNGVAFFNQYAANNSPLTNEIISFDQYNGHPQQEDRYHYHEEPLALTAELGKDALLGFLLDGFPVYGPQENGKTITNADLDAYHGHFGVTADYPNGIYHYHTTAETPYINGGSYYGTPGTVLK